METDRFDDLRPYEDSEIPDAMQRIVNDPYFFLVAHFLFPHQLIPELQQLMLRVRTVDQVQVQVMHPIIQSIVAKTMAEFTFDGIQYLNPQQSYLYVSNHRDIVLDSFLLQYALFLNSIPTSEITFGDNLMMNQFVIDIGKSNKMFKVIRQKKDLREFLKNSQRLSAYIRYTLTQKKTSIWIAQRGGRTKDGNDLTDQGLIKMFGMSGGKDLATSFEQLHIVPIAISYEHEPCDLMKIKEIYRTAQNGEYVKAKDEDLKSIVTGLTQSKGKVHISICPPVTRDDLEGIFLSHPHEFHKGLASLMDRRIHHAYRLYPNNYIAYDLRSGSLTFNKFYTPEDENIFRQKISMLGTLEGDKETLYKLLFDLYANPVSNAR